MNSSDLTPTAQAPVDDIGLDTDNPLAGASTEEIGGAIGQPPRLFTQSGSEAQESGNHSGYAAGAFPGLAFDTGRECLLVT